MSLSLKTSFKSVLLLFAIALSFYALAYDWIYANPTQGIELKLKSLIRFFVYSHLIGGGLALLFGAIQLFSRQGSRWHRQLGKGYCLAVLVGGIGGGYLSFFSDVGPATGVGFFTLAILWLYSTYLAYVYARSHQIDLHRRWIIRSFAMTAAAISLRLELIPLTFFFSFETSYVIVAWGSWIGNLILAEIYLFSTSRNLTIPKGNVPV